MDMCPAHSGKEHGRKRTQEVTSGLENGATMGGVTDHHTALLGGLCEIFQNLRSLKQLISLLIQTRCSLPFPGERGQVRGKGDTGTGQLRQVTRGPLSPSGLAHLRKCSLPAVCLSGRAAQVSPSVWTF